MGAWEDLEGVLKYIGQRSPANAIKVIDRLLADVDALEILPKRYAPWPQQREQSRQSCKGAHPRSTGRGAQWTESIPGRTP